MPDISICNGEGCPLKEKCYRYKAKPSEYRQAYIAPPYKDGECDMFWDMSKEKEKKSSVK